MSKPKTVRMTLHMTPEFRAFLTYLREKGGFPTDSSLFDAAITQYATVQGLTPPARAYPLGYNLRPHRKNS